MSKKKQEEQLRRDVRVVCAHDLRVESRSITDEETGETREARLLIGVAPPYGEWSEPLFSRGEKFVERIMPGAFDNEEQRKQDVLCSFEHNRSALLGRQSSGTLQLRDTPQGREYAVELPDTSAGRDVLALKKRGDIKGSSFEFYVLPRGDTLSINADGLVERTVTSAVMTQIGPVASEAAYPRAGVSLRTASAIESLRESSEDERQRAEDENAAAREREIELLEKQGLA